MQKHVNLVDLVKSFPTNIFLQNLASIQRRTSPIEFAHLAEKSEKGSIPNLSTKSGTPFGPSFTFGMMSNVSFDAAFGDLARVERYIRIPVVVQVMTNKKIGTNRTSQAKKLTNSYSLAFVSWQVSESCTLIIPQNRTKTERIPCNR